MNSPIVQSTQGITLAGGGPFGRRDLALCLARAPVAVAADGGADNEAAMQRYEQRLARALAQVINILDPGVIVLGGGVSNLERLYDHVPRLWGEFVFSDAVATRLVKNQHGDSSGVRGAAWLWPPENHRS
jgi:fructokinase